MLKPSAIRHAAVLGGGLAGTLAAAAVARHAKMVTVIERHQLPPRPSPRKGVPQARHSHLLWSGGVRSIEVLLPGILDRLVDAGAHRIGIPNDTAIMSVVGWVRRWPEAQFLVGASRDFIDWVVREQVLRNTNISVRQDAEVVGLIGDTSRITGVRIKDHAEGTTGEIMADLVIDATGRGSAAPTWLADIGLGKVQERIVDSGLTYATRIFRAPTGDRRFPLVAVLADPHTGQPGQGAVLMPIENGRWLVTSSSTRGAEPPGDEEGFLQFTRAVRHPIVGDLIAHAEPLTPVYRSHSTVNRRRYFERMPAWPDGLLVLGDALCTYNPVYGHGMSVAAHTAVALRRRLDRSGYSPGAARQLQREIARVVEPAWTAATTQDVLYPGTIGLQPTVISRTMQRYLDRLFRAGLTHRAPAAAVYDAFTLSAPMTRLVQPRILLTTLLNRPATAPADPPFTPGEQQLIAQFAGNHGSA